jgi:hypothetical protein
VQSLDLLIYIFDGDFNLRVATIFGLQIQL